MIRALIAALVFVSPLAGQIEPFGLQTAYPTVMHLTLYEMAAVCSDMEDREDVTRLRWFAADSLVEHGPDGPIRVWGAWNPPHDIILDRGLWYFPPLITHEALHELLQGEIPPDLEDRCQRPVDAVALRRWMDQIAAFQRRGAERW